MNAKPFRLAAAHVAVVSSLVLAVLVVLDRPALPRFRSPRNGFLAGLSRQADRLPRGGRAW